MGVYGAWKPDGLPRSAWIAPAVLTVILTSQFERTREFIRKPYIIGGYMYANGIRVSDYPLLTQQGILSHSTYVRSRSIRPDNRKEAGKDVFMVACSRCHTLNGVNSLVDKLRGMYGQEPWDAVAIDRYVANIHGARFFMPPFPGNAEERKALSEYLATLQNQPDIADGAQDISRRE